MKNGKRILAILGIVILLAAACLPMVFAFGSGKDGGAWFKASLAVAVFVPILAYAMTLMYRFLGKKNKEKTGMIQNVIFDVGNVLVDFQWEKYLDGFGFPKEKRERIADATFRSITWNERDRGTLKEEEYIRQFVDGAPEYEQEIREVIRRSGETISRFDYAVTWVKYLKEQGYHLYILSNYSEYMLEQTRKNMDFLKYMDGIIFSCEVKELKPEAGIYQKLLDTYGLDPECSVFLDDRKENCEGAEKFGIHTIQFQNFKQAASDLKKMGVE